MIGKSRKAGQLLKEVRAGAVFVEPILLLEGSLTRRPWPRTGQVPRLSLDLRIAPDNG